MMLLAQSAIHMNQLSHKNVSGQHNNKNDLLAEAEQLAMALKKSNYNSQPEPVRPTIGKAKLIQNNNTDSRNIALNQALRIDQHSSKAVEQLNAQETQDHYHSYRNKKEHIGKSEEEADLQSFVRLSG